MCVCKLCVIIFNVDATLNLAVITKLVSQTANNEAITGQSGFRYWLPAESRIQYCVVKRARHGYISPQSHRGFPDRTIGIDDPQMAAQPPSVGPSRGTTPCRVGCVAWKIMICRTTYVTTMRFTSRPSLIELAAAKRLISFGAFIERG